MADFGFSDPNDAPPNLLASLKVGTLPGAGSLTVSGVAVAPGQFVSAASIAAGGLRFTPLANANGAGYASFGFQVQDNRGTANGGVDLDSVARTMTIDVTPVNHAPTVGAAIADQSATQDQAFRFTLASGIFADIDAGDVLRYSATLASGAPLPGWLRFDVASKTFSGIPANADVGAIAVRVSASDTAGASASADFGVRVANVNDAPVLTGPIHAQDGTAGLPLSFRLPAATFVDPDIGDGLHYQASLADGTALPAWLAFDAQTQTFSGSPSTLTLGRILVRVTAIDNAGQQAQGTFALTVSEAPADVAPVAQAPAQPTPAPVAAPSPAPAAVSASTVAAASDPVPPSIAAPQAVAVLDVPSITIGIDTPVIAGPARIDTPDTTASALRVVNHSEAVLAEAALAPQFGKLSASTLSQLMRSDELSRKFEEVQRQIQQQAETRAAVIGSSILATGGVSIGYVVWLVRGGVLMSSMMSALPAWQMVDPLPILAAARNGKVGRKGQPDDAELERLFDERSPPPAPAPVLVTPTNAPAAHGSKPKGLRS